MESLRVHGHFGQFDLRTGDVTCPLPAEPLKKYAVRVESQNILIIVCLSDDFVQKAAEQPSEDWPDDVYPECGEGGEAERCRGNCGAPRPGWI